MAIYQHSLHYCLQCEEFIPAYLFLMHHSTDTTKRIQTNDWMKLKQDKLDNARDIEVMKQSFYLSKQYSRRYSATARASLGFSLSELWDLIWIREGFE